MLRALRALFRRRRDDRGANRADLTGAGLALSAGGIISLVLLQAATGEDPLDGADAQGVGYAFDASLVPDDCDPRSTARAQEFSNGAIPSEHLCRLPQDGQYLRADAAAGFYALNEAYKEEFGDDMCVTDSYRPLGEQQRLKREKPNLAATPGTSNHGWGLAVDLCGGINSFGTEQHNWMRANSQRFGWFHPEWAQQGGSLPEAWHWEFDADRAVP